MLLWTRHPLWRPIQMDILFQKIPSSSIKEVKVNKDDKSVYVRFDKTPNKMYKYECSDCIEFMDDLDLTIENKKSVGRFFHEAVGSGLLTVTDYYTEH